MARLPRLDVPGLPQHIVQRGNNRARCFIEIQDYEVYLGLLRDCAESASVRVHAYTLMSNHSHVLATAAEAGSLSRMMHAVGRRYAWHFNRRYDRTGSVFERPFKSSLVESESYLLCCHRYIELNPVRAGIVDDPAKYRWSSYRHNALGDDCPWIRFHPIVADLGSTPGERRAAYRAMFEEGLTDRELDTIRAHLSKGCALGSSAFQGRIARASNRRASIVSRGRPRRNK